MVAADLVGPNAAVAVSPSSSALVAERADVIELPTDPADLTPFRLSQVARQVDVVFLDTSGVNPRTGDPRWTTAQVERTLERLRTQAFRVTFEAEGIYLLNSG